MLHLHTWSPPIPCGMFYLTLAYGVIRFDIIPLIPLLCLKSTKRKLFILGIQKGAPKGALIELLDITYLILNYRKRHYLYIELFRITFLQCEAIGYILLHVQNEQVHQS